MTLPVFATAQQMQDRSQGQISTTSHPFLATELAAASSLIRNYCRWHIADVQPLTVRRRGAGSGLVWLNAMQVTEVTGVTVDGRELTEDELGTVEFDPDTGWTNIWGRLVDVEFSAGFAEIPPDITDLTLMIASRALGSPLGAVREQTLVSSVTWSQPGFNIAGGAFLLAHEKAMLAGTYRLGRMP